jgi:very-short-patch-repair endonuclease
MVDELDDLEGAFVSISDEEYTELQAKVRQGNSLDFHGRYAQACNWQLKRLVLQAAYRHYLPSILETAKSGHLLDPNIITWEFSPIEDATWHQIKTLGLPFYPQFPILEYFADFADPFRKIAIEVNRRELHSTRSHNIRKKLMRQAGWEVYRIPTCAAMRYLEDIFSADMASEIEEAINSEQPFSESNKPYLKMAESTLDGYLLVLRRRCYTKN